MDPQYPNPFAAKSHADVPMPLAFAGAPGSIQPRDAPLGHMAREFSGEVRAQTGRTLNTKSATPGPPMNSKLYVGNLSFDTTEADLRGAFEAFGTITDVHIASDRYTGRPRGFAFVTFNTEAESKAAAEKLSGTVLNGERLTVNEARPTAAATPTRQFTSPDRRAGAFHARGKRRR